MKSVEFDVNKLGALPSEGEFDISKLGGIGEPNPEIVKKIKLEQHKPLIEAAQSLGVPLIPKYEPGSALNQSLITGKPVTPAQIFKESVSGDNYVNYLKTEIQKKVKENEEAQKKKEESEAALKAQYLAVKYLYDLYEPQMSNIAGMNTEQKQALADRVNEELKPHGYNFSNLKQTYESVKKRYDEVKQINYYNSLPNGEYDSSVNDRTYEYINRDSIFKEQHSEDRAEDLSRVYARFNDARSMGKYNGMTDREIGVYNYIYKNEGKKAANKYLDFINDNLEMRNHAKVLQNLDEFANKNHFTAGVAAVASVPLKVGSAVEQIGNSIEYVFTGEMEINKYSDYSSTLRQGMANLVDIEIGDWDVFDFVYNSTMSGVDSFSSSFLGPAGPILLGLDAAASTSNDIIRRGGTASQAFWGGLSAGFFEGFFERISLGQINALKEVTETTWKQSLGNLVKSVFVNASEEAATETANILYDTFINKDISNYSAIYDEHYREALSRGLSEEEARKEAKTNARWELVGQVIEAAASGAFMGGEFSAAHHVMSRHNASNIGKIIAQNNAQDSIIQIGLSMDISTDSYKIAETIKEKGEISNVSLGRLATQILNDVSSQKNDIVTNSVSRYATTLGISEAEAKSVAKYYGKAVAQQGISRKEFNSVKNSTFANNVAKELQTDAAWVNDMKSELLPVEAIEKQVREAITFPESQNSRLQSTANGENVQNSRLQSSAEGDIINNGQETDTGDDINGSTNPELLGGRTLSTTDRSGNGVRQQGENSRKISSFVGVSSDGQGNDNTLYRAGDSGWFVRQADQKGEIRDRFEESIRGKISRIAPSGLDTIGRKISNEIREKFKNTVFKDENGNLLSLYHWTQATFEVFAKGEFGFHFGTLDAAHDRYTQSLEEDPNTQKGIYKEVYLNITNPYYVPFDAGTWRAQAIAYQIKKDGIINEEQYEIFRQIEGFDDNTYDNPAARAVRDLLKQKGYDGIIYENDSEDAGGISVIAFDADQILTVAENGVLKPNNGVSEADLDNGPASFMPENDSGASDSSDNDSGELHRDGDIVTFGGIDTENGKHLDKAQQDEIKNIGKKLGQEVVFEDFYKLEKFKGKKKVPDGYFGKDGKVHINYYAKKPVQFLLKHEITHYLKRKLSDFAYQDFMGFVFKSKAFTNWMHSTGFSSMYDLQKDVYDRYSEVKNFNEEKCFDEILADFVGDYLFGGENAVSQKLINALGPKQKKTFMETIKDIIAHIKGIFSEKARQNARLQKEISDLEDRFLQLYNEAVAAPVKENNNLQDEFAIAGKNANTANHNKLIDAIRRITSGEDSESVRRVTGWYKGPDGKWRYYIPDNELNADKLVSPNFNRGKLGDVIVHDKLFEAYPQLKNLDIRFDDLPKRKRGKYLSDSNEIVLSNALRNDVEELKDTLVHEIQHAIQEIEEFAPGGNKSVGLAVALNWAYDKVKDTQEFNELDNRFAKRKYITSVALEGLNAQSIQELQSKMYRAIYGEVESRDVTSKRKLDADALRDSKPDTDGLVIDIEKETTKFVENFTEMGYTEEEILNFFKGEQNDISGSNRNFEGRNSDIDGKSERGYGQSHISSSLGGTRSSDGRVERKSGVNRPGISSGVHERTDSGRLVRGIEEFDSQDSEDYSIPADSNPEELLEAYENGEISRQEYLDALKKEKTLNPKEIADLTEEDANTTPKLKKQKGESIGDKESKFYSSVLESDIFDLNFKAEVATDSFVQKYTSVTNKETLLKAAKELDEGGRGYVSEWWARKPEHASLIDTAVGLILMDRYQRVGDYVSGAAVAEKVRAFGTAGGQQIQIFSILGRLNPETMAVYAQRELDKMFDTYADSHTKKWCDKNADKFKLTEDEIAIIRLKTLQAAKLPEGRDKAIRLAEIATILQDKVPPQKGQGIRAYQRISMLLNPKTNIRNFTGNAIMVPVFIFSDFFGSGIDKAVSKGLKTNVRTTGNFDIKSLKGLKKGAYETMDDFRRHIHTRNENLDRFEVGDGKSFNEDGNGLFGKGVLRKQLNDLAKTMNALDRFTSFCLELGDRPFYEMWFINSINNQKKLNNVEVETPEMVAIASLEALQRTWQDSNKVVKVVANSKQALNTINIGGYGLGDVMIKFTKTPANLTKAIFDFSPAGVVKSIAVDGKKMYQAIQKGKFEAKMQKQFVDSLSKGIAGSILYILVGALFSAGLITGGGDDDKDVSNFEKYIQGVPEYSFKAFGKWWSYEWMQPLGAIGAIVSDFMKSKEENPDNTFGDDILEAIRAGGDVLYNQSFMKSIQSLFTADNVIDGVIESLLNEPSVYVPQLVSQISSTTDEYRRVSYENGKPIQNSINSVKAKLPFLRQTLPKQIDVFGREVKNPQKSILNAFFNPANTFTDTSNEVTDKLYALYEQTKDKTIMPRVAPYSFEVKGNKINFTAEERMEFQAATGKRSLELLSVLFESKEYSKLSDTQKVKVINKIYTYCMDRAKSELNYDYATLSAMEGNDKNGKPILSEEKYKKLPEDAREMIAQDYFLTKTEVRYINDYRKLIEYYIRQAKE